MIKYKNVTEKEIAEILTKIIIALELCDILEELLADIRK